MRNVGTFLILVSLASLVLAQAGSDATAVAPGDKNITMTLALSQDGNVLNYRVALADEKKSDAHGLVRVVIMRNDSLVFASERAAAYGSFSGAYPVNESGTYQVIAFEDSTSISKSASIKMDISGAGAAGPVPGLPAGGAGGTGALPQIPKIDTFNFAVITLILLLLIVAAYFVWKRRRKKRG